MESNTEKEYILEPQKWRRKENGKMAKELNGLKKEDSQFQRTETELTVYINFDIYSLLSIEFSFL